ncbi:MAG TPA: MBL fold metallo-hydrolase [Candidatus Acidoferrales bacterium]|nr:MBL fold metallo-hydrolase [Candidatus Acidoferrales bacterium]
MDSDRKFGAVTVIVGEKNGKYPHGNSILVRGRDATAIIDPSLSVVARAEEFRGRADLVLQSHVHEDHVAGVHLFPAAEVHAHREDAPGLRSLDGLMDIYGYGDLGATMRDFVVSNFHYVERPDTRDFENGALFELGGAAIRAFHLPGHTRGHCALLIEPAGVLFLGDIDLTGFGPYYGDAWSNLDAFEHSLRVISVIDARVWVSFHHVGVVEDRHTFEEKLQRFRGKIAEREKNMLEFLREPHSLKEMVAHRFLYPPHANLSFIDAAERRTIEQHLKRLLESGAVQPVSESRYRALRAAEH